MSDWWLISDEDVQAIKKGLNASLLHTLVSGLHETEAIPQDWKDVLKDHEITVTIRPTERNANRDSAIHTRIEFEDSRGILAPRGERILGLVTHVSEKPYKHNDDILNFHIETDLGIKLKLIINTAVKPDESP